MSKKHREWLAIGLAAAVGALFTERIAKPKIHKGLKVRSK